MTILNFNWFLHVILFYHSKHVIAKRENWNSNDSKKEERNDASSSFTVETNTSDKEITSDECSQSEGDEHSDNEESSESEDEDITSESKKSSGSRGSNIVSDNKESSGTEDDYSSGTASSENSDSPMSVDLE